MPTCNYCPAEIEWIENPDPRAVKPDGTRKKMPINMNGAKHECPGFAAMLEKKRAEARAEFDRQQELERLQKQDELKKRWQLPVYCPLHGEYEPTSNPCQFILDTGFIPHRPDIPEDQWSHPGLWYEKWWSEHRHKKHLEKKTGEDVPWATGGKSIMEQFT